MFDLVTTHPAVSTVLAWLATYLLHSTLLLALAALASRSFLRHHLVAEEAVWRVALFGPIATASIQLAAGFRPVFGALTLATAPVVSTSPQIADFEPLLTAASSSSVQPLGSSGLLALSSFSLATWLVMAWGLIGFALLARLAVAYRGLSRRLDPRLEVVGGAPFRLLGRLIEQAELGRPVQLTCAHRLPVPVALGVFRAEIAVPPRALSHLEPAEQESLLAHELAHLARRDPLSLALTHAMAALFFFQPLNWVARKRLRAISELLCDQWAVDRTGRPVTLARCLATVADWSLGTRLPAPGMADPGTPLAQRIRRLLDRGAAPVRALPRGAFAALIAVLIAFAVVAPAVTANAERADRNDLRDNPSDASAEESPEPIAPEEDATFEDEEAELDEPSERASEDAVIDFDRDEERTYVRREAPEAEIAEQARRMEAFGRAFEERMKELEPELERLAQDAERKAREAARLGKRSALDAEEFGRATQRLVEEALRSIPPKEELERLAREASRHAQIDKAEIERITREALALAEKHRPSEREIAEIRRQAEQSQEALREQVRASETDMQEAIRRALREAREALREAQRELELDRERLAPEADRLRDSGRNLGRAPRAPRASRAPEPPRAPRAPRAERECDGDCDEVAPPSPPSPPSPREARAPSAPPAQVAMAPTAPMAPRTPRPHSVPRPAPTPAPVAAPNPVEAPAPVAAIAPPPPPVPDR